MARNLEGDDSSLADGIISYVPIVPSMVIDST